MLFPRQARLIWLKISIIMLSSEIIRHLSGDPVLAPLVAQIELPPLQAHNDVFNALLRSIVSQQLSTKAAATIYGRFSALFEEQTADPETVLSRDPETFRAVGLSRQKTTYIREVATFFSGEAGNRDWSSLSDDQVIQELTSIKGVGKWTVQMILMFHMGRPDVFPLDDLGIRQSMAELYHMPEEKRAMDRQMEAIAENWRPWRSHACRILWKWRDFSGDSRVAK